jgi:hypothetical protein
METIARRYRLLWYAAAVLLYLALTTYQLGLPGLHYDEAREAGVNAMEILTGAPVQAFRGAGVELGGRTWPLMVQDYIGALNVYLALPFLAATGIGVPNLRLLAVLTGLAALLLLERTLAEWVAWRAEDGATAGDFSPRRRFSTPVSISGLLAVTLLAVSPSFIFWSRQGIFVTNLTQPFVLLCLWQGVRWLRSGRGGSLVLAAFAGGLALYAKLLAVWVVGPFALLAAGWWLWVRTRRPRLAPPLDWRWVFAAVVAFLAPLAPLLLFNLRTGGTLASVTGNLGRSYYGVDNANLAGNLPVRWGQLIQVLRGDQFWYLGGVFANPVLPWLAAAAILVGFVRNWRVMLAPLLLVAAAFCCSLVTISDLFVTHFALLQPLIVGVAALGLGAWVEERRAAHFRADGARSAFGLGAAAMVLVFSTGLDTQSTLRYHQALAATGGLADHSDASYHLAYHLQYNGLGAPIALDWGMDAPVRYLTRGAVTPIEVFGYASPAVVDPGFAERLGPFLANPDNVYLLHAPGYEVFHGRRATFLAEAAARGLAPLRTATFSQLDGTPLYEIWRATPP